MCHNKVSVNVYEREMSDYLKHQEKRAPCLRAGAFVCLLLNV